MLTEAAGSLRALADKTGTLTVGQPRAVSIEPLDGRSADDPGARRSQERHSNIRVGEAITRAAHSMQDQHGNQIVSDVSATTGRGISGRCHSSARLKQHASTCCTGAAQLAALESAARRC